jgi:hypothetical protein
VQKQKISVEFCCVHLIADVTCMQMARQITHFAPFSTLSTAARRSDDLPGGRFCTPSLQAGTPLSIVAMAPKKRRCADAQGSADTAAICRALEDPALLRLAAEPEPEGGGRAVERNGLARAVKLKPDAEGRVLFNDAARRRNCSLSMPETVQREFALNEQRNTMQAAVLPVHLPATILKLLGLEQGERFFLSDDGQACLRKLLTERCEAGAVELQALTDVTKKLRGEQAERQQQLASFALPNIVSAGEAKAFQLRSTFVQEHGQRMIAVIDQLRWLGAREPIIFWNNTVKKTLEEYIAQNEAPYTALCIYI